MSFLFIGCQKGILSKENTSAYKQWHTITLAFDGPETSENDAFNPFLHYRLSVEFQHEDSQQTIRGYYAADGNAGESSAASGNQWNVRFTPNEIGKWTYKATFHQGDNIALSDDLTKGERLTISNSNGNFTVVASDKKGDDFRSKGRLEVANGYFQFRTSGDHWMKAGANSPENLLAYIDFDNTFRIKAEAREGEAAAPQDIHTFLPHRKDWNSGDPTWKEGKGKSLIGAINYLASKRMNSIYFLTLNILGDGKDVWPYADPNDFTRFDVSKLEQWEIVFQHMQSKGILLHLVLQETENETLLDNGETGPLRQLYFRELIARFGHHLALVWNLGEENGPAPWSPEGQNDAQRKAMAKFIKEKDPYHHPVLLHTHSYDPLREEILDDILGYEHVDGLSLQQAERKEASKVVDTWKNKSKASNQEWLITMDEIGMWHTAALTDAEDSTHYTLRRYALWGTLMSGAAGVEWYFGAHHPHNDLTSEDWRQRDHLWEITNHAKEFFTAHLPYWEMQPAHDLVDSDEAYCFRKKNEMYTLYFPEKGTYSIDLTEANGTFELFWYNPYTGGELQSGIIKTLVGGGIRSFVIPNNLTETWPNPDCVLLLKR